MVFKTHICNYKYYISQPGEESIINYKYKGGSDSLFYTYCWSPLCNWIVDHLIPSRMAPNMITVIAFLQLITWHIVTQIYSPDYQTPLPQWLILMDGFSILIYQTLDNCDGKQARKTGSSSPLGIFFKEYNKRHAF
jgi:ethanolaminephosphotransferase